MKKKVQKSKYVTKEDLDVALDHYQKVILDAVSKGFEEMKKEQSEIRKSINHLTTTLDGFLKRMTDMEGEFVILKAEVAMMKRIFKEKLGVEISLQGR
ncbi:MAG TPA: hypothetical protein VJJ22_05375 [Candidatus Paceibacterota bacterium]